MVDTLALNARSLRGFVEGNMMTPEQEGQKGRLELEDEEGWLLGESAELAGIAEGVEIQLEDGKLEDVRGALEGLREEEKELLSLRTKTTEVRKRIAARKDPDQLAQQHATVLPIEAQTQQSELRQGCRECRNCLRKLKSN